MTTMHDAAVPPDAPDAVGDDEAFRAAPLIGDCCDANRDLCN